MSESDQSLLSEIELYAGVEPYCFQTDLNEGTLEVYRLSGSDGSKKEHKVAQRRRFHVYLPTSAIEVFLDGQKCDENSLRQLIASLEGTPYIPAVEEPAKIAANG